MISYTTVPQYINSQTGVHKKYAKEIRAIIKKAIPKAEEIISYNMPAYKTTKVLVYFNAFKNHLGFYPTPSAITAFAEQLKEYSTSKGCIRFLYTQKLPVKLINDICKFRQKEELEKKG